MVQTSSELLRLARSKGIVYVDPRIDYAFKLLFGTPGNEDLLLRLVQAILPEKHIAAVELTAQEQVGPRPDARRSVIDVKCKTDDGSDLIIEMQIKEQEDFTDRMVFYSSFPIINRLQIGENGYNLTPLYVIGITDFIIPNIKENDHLINHYMILNDNTGIPLTDSIHYITVELPKLTKTLSEVKDTEEWILYTIKHIGAMKRMPGEYRGSYLEKFFELSKFAAMDELTQEEYLARFMFETDQKSFLRTAHNKGVAEGMEKGLEQGLQQGANEARLQTARRMLERGFGPETIADVTQLTLAEIHSLSCNG